MIRSPAGFDGGDRIKRYLDYYQPSYGVMMLSAGQFSPASLFAAGAQGAWYDPSDLSTMFQDSAGATPVTAVEQPVGRILDKSGRGNFASQSTPASRPVLSAKVNLLTYTEQFDNAIWVKNGVTITADQTTAPDGTNTADKCAAAVAGGLYQENIATISGVNYTFTVWIKGVSSSGTCGLYFSNPQATPDNGTTANFTTSWQKFTLTGNATSSTTYVDIGTWDNLNNGPTQDIFIWGADFRATNDGVGIPAYQRVAAATNYDTTGFPYYLRFDGSDDSLATASIDFSATNKTSVFAGIRKLSDAATGLIVELSANRNTNNGSFTLAAPPAASATYGFGTKGNADSFQTISGYPSPITNVLTALADIPSDINIIRVNGVQAGSSSSDQGSVNYGNYPLYIGRRGGTTLPFNGRMYSLIVCGAALSAAQISATETWVNGKTGAY